MRLFVAALLPPRVVEDLEEFLEPRRSAAGAPHWSAPAQWHLTLSFMGSAPERRLDGLLERLAERSPRWTPLSLQVRGGGAFPHVGSAKVLYAGVHASPLAPPSAASASPDPARSLEVARPTVPDRTDSPGHGERANGSTPLASLSRSVRHACSAAGAEPDGARFRPHVTLGRFRPPVEATRWVRLLDTYVGPSFPLTDIVLIESHLGQGAGGHPRHDIVETFPLGTST